MARFTNLSKISKEELEESVLRFCEGLALLDNPVLSMRFLTDLLSKKEIEMLARRLKIAELLLDGQTYDEIRIALKASHGTIARIQEWLQESGEGYRIILDKLSKKKPSRNEDSKASYSWRYVKRRLPLTFWPVHLAEEIARSANKRQRERLRGMLKTLDKKSHLYKSIDRALLESNISNISNIPKSKTLK